MIAVVDSASTGTPAARPSRWNLVTAALALVLTVLGAFWTGFGGAYLGRVLVTQRGVVSLTLAPSLPWAVLALLTALGLLLLTSPRGWVGRVDPVGVFGALWTLAWLVGLSAAGSVFALSGPQAHCVYAGCWPRGWQELLAGAPLVAAALLVLGMATAGRRMARPVRAVLPAVVYLALTVVQVAVWDGLFVPVLDGPPPFTF